MATTTIPVRVPLPALPRLRLPASFAVSIGVHLFVFVVLAWLIRAMPAVTAPRHATTPAPLSAMLAAAPSSEVTKPEVIAQPSVPEPLPALVMPLTPLPMSPLPPSLADVSPIIRTPIPGISIDPATFIIDESFAPVGHIVNNVGNGRAQFGANIADQMKQRFPQAAARTPVPIGAFPTLYPARAAREGRSLNLAALLTISADGRVTEVRVMPDDPPFVQAIVAALKNARFTPAEREGKLVPYWTIMEFRFEIDGPTNSRGERIDR